MVRSQQLLPASHCRQTERQQGGQRGGSIPVRTLFRLVRDQDATEAAYSKPLGQEVVLQAVRPRHEIDGVNEETPQEGTRGDQCIQVPKMFI